MPGATRCPVHPRTHGEEPAMSKLILVGDGSPPSARGRAAVRPSCSGRATVHPRTHGEEEFGVRLAAPQIGPAPQAWERLQR